MAGEKRPWNPGFCFFFLVLFCLFVCSLFLVTKILVLCSVMGADGGHEDAGNNQALIQSPLPDDIYSSKRTPGSEGRLPARSVPACVTSGKRSGMQRVKKSKGSPYTSKYPASPGGHCLFGLFPPNPRLKAQHSSLIEASHRPAAFNRAFEEDLAPASKPEGTWA